MKVVKRMHVAKVDETSPFGAQTIQNAREFAKVLRENQQNGFTVSVLKRSTYSDVYLVEYTRKS